MSLAAPFPYFPHSGIEVRPDMADMRAMRHAGSTLAEVAAMAGCSVTHAQRIVSGKEV